MPVGLKSLQFLRSLQNLTLSRHRKARTQVFVNLIILQLSHADSFDIFDKASLSFNQSEIGLRVLHKINIGL